MAQLEIPPLDEPKLFKKLFQHSLEAIFIIDPVKERVIEANPAAERLLGYTRDELIGLSVATVHPKEMHRLRWFVDTLLQEGSGWTDELTCTTRSGEVMPAEISAFTIDISGTTYVTSVVRNISERRCHEEELRHLATHDQMTGLSNRTLFMEHLEQARQRLPRDPDQTIAVLWIDLDQFKAVNDRFGHFTGDQLLIAVARLLNRTFRSEDIVARFGGDEFTVLIKATPGTAGVAEAVARFRRALEQPFTIGEHTIACQASIGVGFADPSDPDAMAVVHRSYLAARRAKDSGGDRRPPAATPTTTPKLN